MKINRHTIQVVLLVSAIFIMTVSGLAILGYILNIPYFMSWGCNQNMALPTAILFFSIGLNYLIFSLYDEKNNIY